MVDGERRQRGAARYLDDLLAGRQALAADRHRRVDQVGAVRTTQKAQLAVLPGGPEKAVAVGQLR